MFRVRTSRGIAGRKLGFTLVELLVVITIIGILVGMLLPAVNAARESGRGAQCRNNLRQLGTAILAHEEAQGIFPTGGWGWFWVGDPDHGYGDQQPGGWIYNILPNIEKSDLHDLGRYGATDKKVALQTLIGTPLFLVQCPTRRRDATYPMSGSVTWHNLGGVTTPAQFPVARTDYAINVGDSGNDEIGAGPDAGAAPNGPDSLPLTDAGRQVQAKCFGTRKTDNMLSYTGICFEQSTIRKDDVKDGLSCTLLLGEKYLGMDSYGTGTWYSDNECMYVGMDNDIGRTTCKPPMQDRHLLDDTLAFGSAHPNAANFVLCDGSTNTISYSVDAETFRRLGTRSEGLSVDASKLGL